MDDPKKKLQLLKKPENDAPAKGAAPTTQAVAPEDEIWEEHPVFGFRYRVYPPPDPIPQIQEANEPEFEPFRIGQLTQGDRPGEPMALPHPKWPEPGKVASDEVRSKYFREHQLWLDAQTNFRRLLMHYKLKSWRNGGDDGRNQVGIDEDNRLAVEYKRFLEGVWLSHGLPVPSDEAIEAMAIEGLKQAKLNS